ncbi:MAG: CopD family protein [Bacteroidota bacterium]|nr:CopD family protein [Bacteroidota bacterium]MDP3144645.1 CopD family protein [Bacteroidota bacterium]
MDISYVKALHIIFVICWFAALFYIVRLFIYCNEAQGKDDIARPILTQQLLIMQKKLWYIIGWPSMIGTYIFGFWMIFSNMTYYLSQPWMWLKLIAVGLLTAYHIGCQSILNSQNNGLFKLSSFKLRMFNELATVFLVGIVFLVVVKSTSGLLWGILGLIAFAVILMLSVTIYKRVRTKNETLKTSENNTSNEIKK